MDEGKIEILKEQIKKYIKQYLEEMMTTGGAGGPGTGASFTQGSGENYATPNWVGGSAKNPKKKKYLVSKTLTWENGKKDKDDKKKTKGL